MRDERFLATLGWCFLGLAGMFHLLAIAERNVVPPEPAAVGEVGPNVPTPGAHVFPFRVSRSEDLQPRANAKTGLR